MIQRTSGQPIRATRPGPAQTPPAKPARIAPAGAKASATESPQSVAERLAETPEVQALVSDLGFLPQTLIHRSACRIVAKHMAPVVLKERAR